MVQNCPFCDHSKETIVLKNELCHGRYDTWPVSDGHFLIIPDRHVSSYFDATREEKMCLITLIDEAKILLDERYKPDAYNIGINIGEIAGQGIMHLHVHIIPRYEGDTDRPKGGVRKVITKKRGKNSFSVKENTKYIT